MRGKGHVRSLNKQILRHYVLEPRRGADLGKKVSNPSFIRQDMPPPGGMPPVRKRRNLRYKAWQPITIMIGIAAVVSYGWRQKKKFYLLNDERHMEDKLLSSVVQNFIDAENDLAFVAQQRAYKKKVEELFDDLPEYRTSDTFYESDVAPFKYPINRPDLALFLNTGLLSEERRDYAFKSTKEMEEALDFRRRNEIKKLKEDYRERKDKRDNLFS